MTGSEVAEISIVNAPAAWMLVTLYSIQIPFFLLLQFEPHEGHPKLTQRSKIDVGPDIYGAPHKKEGEGVYYERSAANMWTTYVHKKMFF